LHHRLLWSAVVCRDLECYARAWRMSIGRRPFVHDGADPAASR
jgi:hypothetical protein